MNTDLEKAIAKVRKLFELARNNTSENEVKAATAAADKIMQEFRISLAQLEAAENQVSEKMVHKDIHKGGRRTNWRESILRALCIHYGCAWYMTHSRKKNYNFEIDGYKQERTCVYTIVGRESDTEIISYMFDYLTTEGERLSKAFNRGTGRGYAKSWLDGFGSGAASQFEKMDAEIKSKLEISNSILGALGTTSTSSAMVLLSKRGTEAEKYMNSSVDFPTYERGPNKGKVKGTYGIYGSNADAEAKKHGYETGKKININKGMQTKDETKFLK